MLRTRVIPCLLMAEGGLVKTERFRKRRYIGEPINAVRIYNDKLVDEIVLLDIEATRRRTGPDFDVVEKIISEAFMPFCYGGGVRSVDDADRLYSLGVEKVAVNAGAFQDPELVARLADRFGSQSVVGAVDAKRGLWGGARVYRHDTTRRLSLSVADRARKLQELGAGELLVTAVDRDGTMAGYDLQMLEEAVRSVDIPVIGCGGAGSLDHMVEAVARAGVSGVAAGALFVFRGRRRGVLINYPSQRELAAAFGSGVPAVGDP